MIFPLAGLVIGAALGAWQASVRRGAPLDLAQWAAVGAILGGLVGLFVLIALKRSLAAA